MWIKYDKYSRSPWTQFSIISHHQTILYLRYYLSSVGCMYVCWYQDIICVVHFDFSHNCQSRAFKLLYNSLCEYQNSDFSYFWKRVYRVIGLFYISFRFFCRFEEEYKTKEYRKETFYVQKLTGRRKIKEKMFAQRVARFFLFSICHPIGSLVNCRHYTIALKLINNNIPYETIVIFLLSYCPFSIKKKYLSVNLKSNLGKTKRE